MATLLNGFPLEQLREQIAYFSNAFDVQRAKDTGEFLIYAGIEAEYDELCEQVKTIEKDFARYLTEQKRALGYV